MPERTIGITARKKKIATSFVPRGGESKDESKSLIREELARVRATTMEGSFGTQKEHYGLRKVNARLRITEVLTIFSASTLPMQCCSPVGWNR